MEEYENRKIMLNQSSRYKEHACLLTFKIFTFTKFQHQLLVLLENIQVPQSQNRTVSTFIIFLYAFIVMGFLFHFFFFFVDNIFNKPEAQLNGFKYFYLNTNVFIYNKSFVCTQFNDTKYCYVFNNSIKHLSFFHTVKWSKSFYF